MGVDVEESREQILAFVKTQPLEYPIVLDQEGEIANRFGLVGIPASLLLAQGGEIIYFGFSLPRIDEYLEKGALR